MEAKKSSSDIQNYYIFLLLLEIQNNRWHQTSLPNIPCTTQYVYQRQFSDHYLIKKYGILDANKRRNILFK